MAFLAAAASYSSSQLLLRPKIPKLSFPSTSTPFSPLLFSNSPSLLRQRAVGIVFAAAARSSSNAFSNDSSSQKSTSKNPSKDKDKKAVEEEEEIEVEEELPWIQEKALDLVEFTGSVTQAIPGPRVGQSSLPWILALPLAYAELVANLIQLRKVSTLDDSQVTDIVNDISRRIVKEKGPVVMDMTGYTERGLRENLLCKPFLERCIIYLSEDADKLRLHTLSEAGDLDSLDKMVYSSDSDTEDYDDHSSNAP
ncbi:hypothetical protein GH714_034192 [Hevea brasiliensis]|uniref:Armadillo-like repeats domain-containing protein n=1 Tax=Hevea brasiliensis TaxID=3981 RepID=A0A6A6MIU7_HEVBR|nr:hypothetical protein GH714_034192 [Hevea brasiliensis]